ncbi:regulating synaptic membrane exocytosis protein 2-like isoform X9 [Anguilla rostrata]|uniref:regulating synaptic membrane exocytosis protein 2-like isoform X9 n=1 Tax=Anguilla rostrata TaxID=7938 RepID=UPI0030D303E5
MSAPLGPRGGPAAPPAAALPEMPDLSHLTEEERKIILAVMDRQKKEEEKEQSMLKDKEEQKPQPAQWFPFSGITELVNNVLQPQQKSQNEKDPDTKLHQQFEMYKDQVKKIGEEAQLTQEQKGDTPTCGICHKTKFADGCGHICSYCQTKFCARCGGRVALRSNKEDKVVMWVCNLCRKQQEILTKSGAWFYGSPNSSQQPGGADGARGRRHEEAPQEKRAKLQGPSPDLSDKSRPYGLPRQESLRNGSGLRHSGPGDGPDGKRSPSASRDPNQKYDQREERGDCSQYALSDGGMPRSPSDYGGQDPRRAGRGSRMYEDADTARGEYQARRGRWRSQEYPPDEELDPQLSEYELQRRREEEYQARYRSDPNLARYPVKPQPYEEQMRIHAEVSRARHERRHSDVSLAYTELDEPQGPGGRGERSSRPRGPAPGEGLRSYSVDRTSPSRRSNHSPPTPRRSPVLGERAGPVRVQQHHLDPSSAVRKTKREKMETMLRNDSLSSDQSESVRPPPPKPHKTKKLGKMRQLSFSSSEEELATTPEYTSCEDVEIESESVSEKGDSQRGKRKAIEQAFMSDSAYTLTERQKKTVRFGGDSFEEDLEWCEPQVKDSGVDTCSSTTLNEEHSHSEKHPVTWQPSKDGERLIGRILLNKRMKDGSVPRDTGALLGLKVVGGKMTESGRLCAFITKVKKGSLADTVGHLRPGDQVLEWNGRHLQGATFKEVYNIILESKPEPQVELVVSRPTGDVSRIPDSTHAQLESSSSSFESQKMERPSISVTSPMSPGMLRDAPQYLSGQLSSQSLSRRTAPFVPRVQVKLWYDKVGHQLIVTILGAKDLPSREDGRPRNPYVKIYFLPDRSVDYCSSSDKSKRRTKTVKKSLEPKWNQTFMYSPVHRREFRERMLEITLWDQARVREEESEFLGEILIELETALLDDQPHWYKLQTHDVSSMPLPNPSPYMQRRLLQGESPTRRLQNKGPYLYNSGSQRISDSEISDFDCEDGIGVISDYRHNGRDLQSSTLSVPEQVMSSNHCSRSAEMNRVRSRSPSVPPPHSRSLDHGARGGPSQYNTTSRMDRQRTSEDRYSPDSHYLTLPPRSRHSQPDRHYTESSSNNLIHPIYREDAVRLLRSTRMARTYSEGAYSEQQRRLEWERRLSMAYYGRCDSPERCQGYGYYHGPNHTPNPWSNHVMNGTCGNYRHCRGLDRHEYHRSRSADQRPALERPSFSSSSRSRSTERPDSNYMRSMPSLPSGRSAPPSPALTRAHPRSGSVQTSPTSTPVSGRRGRQLPQVPSKGTLDRKDGDQGTEPYEAQTGEKPEPPQSLPQQAFEPGICLSSLHDQLQNLLTRLGALASKESPQPLPQSASVPAPPTENAREEPEPHQPLQKQPSVPAQTEEQPELPQSLPQQAFEPGKYLSSVHGQIEHLLTRLGAHASKEPESPQPLPQPASVTENAMEEPEPTQSLQKPPSVPAQTEEQPEPPQSLPQQAFEPEKELEPPKPSPKQAFEPGTYLSSLRDQLVNLLTPPTAPTSEEPDPFSQAPSVPAQTVEEPEPAKTLPQQSFEPGQYLSSLRDQLRNLLTPPTTHASGESEPPQPFQQQTSVPAHSEEEPQLPKPHPNPESVPEEKPQLPKSLPLQASELVEEPQSPKPLPRQASLPEYAKPQGPVTGRKEVTWEDQQRKVNGTVPNGLAGQRSSLSESVEKEAVETESGDTGAMEVEERTRQMKLKMNKYKQGAGSDSRLEQRSGRDPQRGSDNLSTKSSDSDVSDVSAVSRTSSASRFSSTSYMSVQSERPRGNRKISDFTSKMKNRQMGVSGNNMAKSSSISGDMYTLEKTDGSQSDTAVGTVETGDKKRRSSIGAKMVAIVGLSRKSRSTSQLSQTAGGKKLRSTVQRSTETGLAVEMRSRMTRQASRESTDGSMNSYSSEGNLIFPSVRLSSDSQFSDFLDGLGPAQLVGRQTLATPPMGDIQIGMVDKKGSLEVEVIRARGLVGKPSSKALPAPYVKVYLLDNGACVAKKKTKVARKTLDPLYQQQLSFEESPTGKVLQIIVWGDYGRMDHKSFMGAVQILLDDLDLSNMVIGWFKLFPPSSLVDPTLAPLTRRASQSSLDSSSGPCARS